MYEYMACEKPIVTTNVKGLDVIEKINAGKVVNIDNENNVVDAIISILSDSALAKEMGVNARVFVLEGHTWKIVAKKTSDIINSL